MSLFMTAGVDCNAIPPTCELLMLGPLKPFPAHFPALISQKRITVRSVHWCGRSVKAVHQGWICHVVIWNGSPYPGVPNQTLLAFDTPTQFMANLGKTLNEMIREMRAVCNILGTACPAVL